MKKRTITHTIYRSKNSSTHRPRVAPIVMSCLSDARARMTQAPVCQSSFKRPSPFIKFTTHAVLQNDNFLRPLFAEY